MDEEDDDDIYAPDDSDLRGTTTVSGNAPDASVEKNTDNAEEDEEEGEEVEEDGSDSDIDIITERKGEPDRKVEPKIDSQAPRVKDFKTVATSTPPAESSPASHAVKIEAPRRDSLNGRPGSSYPAAKSSSIDVDAKPIYAPSGKAITDMDMDTDFSEDDKPWRRPGTDMTDYFNYGFDEFTWASYCLKQSTLRKEVTDSRKQMEDMQSFLSGGMPSMPAMPGAPPSMPTMGGPNDLPPEMQQLMQQMVAQGMNPMEMGPEQMMQMMQGGGMGDPNQGFGQQAFGQQGQSGQQMGYGGGAGGGGGYGGAGGGRGGRNQGGRNQGQRW